MISPWDLLEAARYMSVTRVWKKEKAMNNKFKVGDKVRCVDADSGGNHLKLGGVYIIERSYMCGANGPVVDLIELREPGFMARRFELVEPATSGEDLDTLIKQANAGMRAIEKLRSPLYKNQVTVEDSVAGSFDTVTAFFEDTQPVFRKAPPLPAPFTLKDSGHRVEFLNRGFVNVGCQTLSIDGLTNGLIYLVRESGHHYSSTALNIDLRASKKGVGHPAGEITWADAEQLLAALEGLAVGTVFVFDL
jgi:hypothetical protein